MRPFIGSWPATIPASDEIMVGGGSVATSLGWDKMTPGPRFSTRGEGSGGKAGARLWPGSSAPASPGRARAYSARTEAPHCGNPGCGLKGNCGGRRRSGRAAPTKARHQGDGLGVEARTRPGSSPGGPATRYLVLELARSSDPVSAPPPQFSSRAAVRPVAGREGRNVPCAVDGPGEVSRVAPPRPAKVGDKAPPPRSRGRSRAFFRARRARDSADRVAPS